MVGHLAIDRSKANDAFASWKLAGLPDGGAPPEATQLLHDVASVFPKDTDYVHARIAALHNHLIQQPSGRYCFLRGGGGLELHSVSDDGASTRLHVLPEPEPAAQPLDDRMPPSVQEVTQHDATKAVLLAVSSGRGDLSLLELQAGDSNPAAAGSRIYPLRPPPPLAGARPFIITAAALLAGENGGPAVRCVLAAVGQRAGRHPARCEVFSVVLSPAEPGTWQALTASSLEQLAESAMAPHGAAVHPITGAVLLALAPGGAGAPTDQGGTQPAARPPADDGDEPASPRTLAAAAARLAQFTSEEPAPDVRHEQYADLYHEAGPDGVGALGNEPPCTLRVYAPAAGDPAGPLLAEPAAEVSCAPHQVLGCSRTSGGGLRLALTDDVDCVVVEVTLLPPGQGAAEGAAAAGFAVRHVATAPALAYVATGKPQRRFLLAGGAGEPVAAALVESSRYVHLYRTVPPQLPYGQYQYLDLGAGVELLGAALCGASGSVQLLGRDRLLRWPA